MLHLESALWVNMKALILPFIKEHICLMNSFTHMRILLISGMHEILAKLW